MSLSPVDLSLNEVETLAAKAARGAGLSWGGAEEVGRAARTLARAGADWTVLVLALDGPAYAEPAAETSALARVEAALATVDGSQRLTRAAVSAETVAALDALAAKTYVPASARSRVSGAGAGLTDND